MRKVVIVIMLGVLLLSGGCQIIIPDDLIPLPKARLSETFNPNPVRYAKWDFNHWNWAWSSEITLFETGGVDVDLENVKLRYYEDGKFIEELNTNPRDYFSTTRIYANNSIKGGLYIIWVGSSVLLPYRIDIHITITGRDRNGNIVSVTETLECYGSYIL